MYKKFIVGIAYVLTIIGIMVLLFYLVQNSIEFEDITENNESSFIEKLIECKNATIEDEQKLEIEKYIEEIEGFELQDEQNIQYNGDNNKKWNIKLGKYQGLTYYSQLDSRWKNNLYTAIGDKTQTIGSSGCGPVCASMIASSIKGTVTPDIMAKIFVENGYRSPNNGTYWSAYRALANELNIDYVETSNFQKALDLLNNNYYIITSCGNGLFTTGGHYIVLVGIKNNILKIYDPYLYVGKFNVSTRRGKVTVKGNTVYCSVQNFQNYANYKQFFCYENVVHNEQFTEGERVLVKIPIKVILKKDGRTLVDDGNNQFWVYDSAINNNNIYGIVTICYKNEDDYIIQFFSDQFWCKSENFVKLME